MPANANGSKWARPDLRWAIYVAFEGACVYCGKGLQLVLRDRTRTLDHLLPRSLGGTNAPENLACCCLSCNVRKAGRSFAAYVATLSAEARASAERRLAAAQQALRDLRVFRAIRLAMRDWLARRGEFRGRLTWERAVWSAFGVAVPAPARSARRAA